MSDAISTGAGGATARRVLLDNHPLAPNYTPAADVSIALGRRPAWIAPTTGQGERPAVLAFRLRFILAEAGSPRIHVSADERYDLWLDGERIGRGPERGSGRAWFYETYELTLSPGPHTFLARVWRLGELAPLAQCSGAPGFMLAADAPFAPLLSTGAAAWEVAVLDGYGFTDPGVPGAFFVGPNERFDLAAAFRAETVADSEPLPWGGLVAAAAWTPAATRHEDAMAMFGMAVRHELRPAMLPAQMAVPRHAGRVCSVAEGDWTATRAPVGEPVASQALAWQALIDGAAPVQVPAHTRWQVIFDLEQYYCAYPQLTVSAGRDAVLTLGWAEALYTDAEGHVKGQRDEVAGRYFVAPTRDVILPDGGTDRRWGSLWWRAGRYLELLLETGDEPLTIEALSLIETRYPMEMESRIATSDAALDRALPIALRGLQMCMHETYMDCPHYEQMMYVGDTRIEALVTYTLSADDRLPRKALTMYDLSRLPSGQVLARYPSSDVQVIPPFSLWWVGMVHDHAAWRGDRELTASLLPGVRSVLDGWLAGLNDEGLLQALPGWNFADWVPAWPIGVPPAAADGVSGLINWHLVYTLGLAAQLEEWAGLPEPAARWRRQGAELAERLHAAFWDEGRGLYADELTHTQFSEHTQCLALLSGCVPVPRQEAVGAALLTDPDLARTTIYFTHYLFEAYRLLGRPDALFDRLGLWYGLPGRGFKTTPEQPEPTRSDCHGWGAHPLYHLFATVLGIRPDGFGFARVDIRPQLGPLGAAAGSLVHPQGRIEVDLREEAGRLIGSVSLPGGVWGMLHYRGGEQELHPGEQHVAVSGR